MIPFNQPHLTGKEEFYIQQALALGKFSGNGFFTKKCQNLLIENYGFNNVFLTNSATSALEIIALLLDLGPEDDVILPSYTFVGTATPFALRGAKLVFCDSRKDHPNIDTKEVKKLISKRTKAIIAVHYGGFSCEMDDLRSIANTHGIYLIEDAAHGIGAKYKNSYLGSLGDFSVFSFHETKNISCGQGGALVINNKNFLTRAEKIWNKGTNKSDLERGLIQNYEWVDLGSNFYPSEITSAFLLAQLEEAEIIQKRRDKLWNLYHSRLNSLKEKEIKLPQPESYQIHNSHIFFLICSSKKERDALLKHLHSVNITAVFHYSPLESSDYFISKNIQNKVCYNSLFFSDCIIRLPLYNNLSESEIDQICSYIEEFYF